MSLKELEGQPGVYYRDWSQTLHTFRIPKGVTYEAPAVHVASDALKSRLLPTARGYDVEGHRILDNLSRIDQPTRLRFDIKSTAVESFVFKLLLDRGASLTAIDDAQSFAILSYSCNSSEWRPHFAIAGTTAVPAGQPLTPIMWHALLGQRLDEREPMWVDQLSIAQQDQAEKSVAIGSMDLLYRSARIVLVVLEDVALTEAQYHHLQAFVRPGLLHKERSNVERDAVAGAFSALVKARWFDRAWCMHEFVVSKLHVFLVPVLCEDASSTTMTIARIDGPLFVEMYHTFVEQDIRRQNAGEPSLMTTQYLEGHQIDRIRRFFTRLRAVQLNEVFGSEQALSDGSYMHMFKEVMHHGSRFNADKVSILLNMMQSGLFLKSCDEPSVTECWRLIGLVALAAGDATVLTASGDCVAEGNTDWLRLPSGADDFRLKGKLTIARTNSYARLLTDGLEADTTFLAESSDLRDPDEHYISIARWLIDHRAMVEMSYDDQEMRLDIEHDEEVFVALRRSYIQALAAALQCGREWMLETYLRSYVSTPIGFDLRWDPALRKTMSDAIDWALAMLIDEDVGEDIDVQWEDAGTIMFADETADESTAVPKEETSRDATEVPHANLALAQWQVEESTSELNGSFSSTDKQSLLSVQEQEWYARILDFVENAVNYGLAIVHEKDGKGILAKRNVRLCETGGEGPYLLVAPSDITHFSVCVPFALVDDAYSWMSRVWLLKPHPRNDFQKFSIVAKSRAYGLCNIQAQKIRRIVVAS